MKFCPQCETSLPLDAFGAHRHRADKKNVYCKACARALQAASRLRRKEMLKAKRGVAATRHEVVRCDDKVTRVRKALALGYSDRVSIQLVTRLDEDRVGDALAELYDQGEAKPIDGKWYLRRKVA